MSSKRKNEQYDDKENVQNWEKKIDDGSSQFTQNDRSKLKRGIFTMTNNDKIARKNKTSKAKNNTASSGVLFEAKSNDPDSEPIPPRRLKRNRGTLEHNDEIAQKNKTSKATNETASNGILSEVESNDVDSGSIQLRRSKRNRGRAINHNENISHGSNVRIVGSSEITQNDRSKLKRGTFNMTNNDEISQKNKKSKAKNNTASSGVLFEAKSNDPDSEPIPPRRLKRNRGALEHNDEIAQKNKTSKATNETASNGILSEVESNDVDSGSIQLRRSKRNRGRAIDHNENISHGSNVRIVGSSEITQNDRSKLKRGTFNITNNDESSQKNNKSKGNKKGRKMANLGLKEKLNNEAPINKFMVNEIVLATIPGYSPWPARILNISDHTIFVEFFGTGQINPVRSGAITRFDITKSIPLLERKGYTKAIRELEMVFNIPPNVSLFQ